MAMVCLWEVSSGKSLNMLRDHGSAGEIANNPQVTLALCTFQGKVLSPTIAGVARRLSGKEARRVRTLLRVGFIGWVWSIIFNLRYPGDKTAVYEVSLVAERQTSEASESIRGMQGRKLDGLRPYDALHRRAT